MAINRIAQNIFFKNHVSVLNSRSNFTFTLKRVTTRAFSNDKGFWSSIVAGNAERSGSHSKILANDSLYELQCKLLYICEYLRSL
jgi:hypothetical protein